MTSTKAKSLSGVPWEDLEASMFLGTVPKMTKLSSLCTCRNIASFSDGPVGSSRGTPYFYLSKMDPTPKDIELDPRCSLSLSEAPLGTCGGLDAENPTCARLTLSGKACCLAQRIPINSSKKYVCPFST
jgi:hypothetical protein